MANEIRYDYSKVQQVRSKIPSPRNDSPFISRRDGIKWKRIPQAYDIGYSLSQFAPQLPQNGDKHCRKTRDGHFLAGPPRSMQHDFKDRGIDTLLIGGLVTEGTMFTAVRGAADLDYSIYIIEDTCLDWDGKVLLVLIERYSQDRRMLSEVTRLCVFSSERYRAGAWPALR